MCVCALTLYFDGRIGTVVFPKSTVTINYTIQKTKYKLSLKFYFILVKIMKKQQRIINLLSRVTPVSSSTSLVKFREVIFILRETRSEISTILKCFLTFWKFSANYRTFHYKNVPTVLVSKGVIHFDRLTELKWLRTASGSKKCDYGNR